MQNIELTYHINEIDDVALKVLNNLEYKALLFNGEMGAGKTTLINAILRTMKSEDIATSPTFSIINEYKSPKGSIYHFDFYRIESLDEAYNFGIEDYLYSNNWLFIEWPDRIEEILPENTQTVTITKIDNETRNLKLSINDKLLTENKAMTEPKF